jgi:hypothetical protein
MTDNSPEDEVMLETSIALSGSTTAFERLPRAAAPVLDRSNSDLSFDVRRPLQSPDANQKSRPNYPRDDA